MSLRWTNWLSSSNFRRLQPANTLLWPIFTFPLVPIDVMKSWLGSYSSRNPPLISDVGVARIDSETGVNLLGVSPAKKLAM